MVKKTLSDWPLDEKLSDTVLDFLIKYPRVLDERVVVYWDNFILTNYRLYYKNNDGSIYLIPHYKVKEYVYKGNNRLILKLRDKTIIELNGPIPKHEVLKKTYKLSDWRKLSKKEDELLEKTNVELGRPVHEKPRKLIEQTPIISETAFAISANNQPQVKASFDRIPFDIKTNSSINHNSGIFCPHCGFKITLNGARFCPNCGVDLI